MLSPSSPDSIDVDLCVFVTPPCSPPPPPPSFSSLPFPPTHLISLSTCLSELPPSPSFPPSSISLLLPVNPSSPPSPPSLPPPAFLLRQVDAANFLLSAEKDRLCDERQHLHTELARLEEEGLSTAVRLHEVEEERDRLLKEVKKSGTHRLSPFLPPAFPPCLPPSLPSPLLLLPRLPPLSTCLPPFLPLLFSYLKPPL